MDNTNIVESLVNDIYEKRRKALADQITPYRRSNIILSDLRDCDRYLVYSVLDWEQKPVHDELLQARFNAGKLWEREAIRELEGLGYNVILSQKPIEIKNRKGDIIATGRIDGMIEYTPQGNGKRYKVPIEIKTMHTRVFDQVKTVDDFKKKPWLRGYVRQLMLYLYGNNEEQGLFLLLDGLGRWKLMPLYLDYGECEYLLQRIERAYENIKAKTYPDRISYAEDICGRCAFNSICLPDIQHKGMEIIDSKEFEGDLQRRQELLDAWKEFEDLDEKIKDQAKAVDKDMLVGDFSIFIRKGEQTRYEVPEEVKLPFKVKVPTTTVKIIHNKLKD